MKLSSKLFSVNTVDVLRGLLVAVVSAAIEPVIESVSAGKLTLDFKHVGAVALCAGLSYLKIKFFTPSKIISSLKHTAK